MARSVVIYELAGEGVPRPTPRSPVLKQLEGNMKNRRILGWVLNILGGILILVGVVSGIANKFIAGKIDGWQFLFLIAVSFFYGGIKAYQLGKKLRAKSAEDLLQHDLRPPVLYLRAFSSDTLGEKKPFSLPFFVPATFLTEEEEIAQVMNQIGPFLTIGQPNDVLPNLGATRLYTKDWQEKVTQLIRYSTLIIVRAGETDSLLWELKTCMREDATQKLVLLLPKNNVTIQHPNAPAAPSA